MANNFGDFFQQLALNTIRERQYNRAEDRRREQQLEDAETLRTQANDDYERRREDQLEDKESERKYAKEAFIAQTDKLFEIEKQRAEFEQDVEEKKRIEQLQIQLGTSDPEVIRDSVLPELTRLVGESQKNIQKIMLSNAEWAGQRKQIFESHGFQFNDATQQMAKIDKKGKYKKVKPEDLMTDPDYNAAVTEYQNFLGTINDQRIQGELFMQTQYRQLMTTAAQNGGIAAMFSDQRASPDEGGDTTSQTTPPPDLPGSFRHRLTGDTPSLLSEDRILAPVEVTINVTRFRDFTSTPTQSQPGNDTPSPVTQPNVPTMTTRAIPDAPNLDRIGGIFDWAKRRYKEEQEAAKIRGAEEQERRDIVRRARERGQPNSNVAPGTTFRTPSVQTSSQTQASLLRRNQDQALIRELKARGMTQRQILDYLRQQSPKR